MCTMGVSVWLQFPSVQRQLERTHVDQTLTCRSRNIMSMDETPLSDIRFLTPAETAKIIGVSKTTIYRLVHSGELEAIRVGREFRIPEVTISQWVAKTADAEALAADDEALGVAFVDGRFRLITIKPDGTVQFVDSHEHYHHLFYVASLEAYGWRALIQELEELINSSKITEHQLQTFFERNPEFLCGDTYESARPHIVLQRPHAGPLIPDFALKPNNADALCDLLELKLPRAQLLTGKDNRRRLSAALLEACAQLREYRDFFERDRNRREIEEVYGLRFFRPKMMVVIGKRSEYLASDLRKAEGDVPQLLITTYDDLLERARSRLRPYSRKVC
jgi:excisionase family DNA binding protein